VDRQEATDVLEDVKEQILDALEQARMAIQAAAPDLWPAAEAYWWAHIRCALDNDHNFLGGSMQTLADTIEALADYEEED